MRVSFMFLQSLLMTGDGRMPEDMLCHCSGCTKSRTSVYLSHGENGVFKSFRRCLLKNMCGSGGFWVGGAAIGLDYGGVISNFTSTRHWWISLRKKKCCQPMIIGLSLQQEAVLTAVNHNNDETMISRVSSTLQLICMCNPKQFKFQHQKGFNVWEMTVCNAAIISGITHTGDTRSLAWVPEMTKQQDASLCH